jgi:Subtilase family
MRRPLVMGLLVAALSSGATAAADTVDPFALVRDPAVQAKVRGGLPLVFGARPSIQGRVFAPQDFAPVTIELTVPPSPAIWKALDAAGAKVSRGPNGRRHFWGRTVLAQVDGDALRAVAALPGVRTIRYDGAPFGLLTPLDGTAEQIEAPAVWRAPSGALTGEGMTICNSDTGVDVFHPSFFHADAGYYAWLDNDGNGRLDPETDGVVIDGQEWPLLVLDGVITSYGGGPVFGSENPDYELGLDWLWVDGNGNGIRDFGAAAGYADAVPAFGEPVFVADDVNGNDELDVGEKIVRLGSSKIAAVRAFGQVFRRGVDLGATPRDEEIAHGTGSSGVMVSGQPGLSDKVGIAPDADLLMAVRTDGSELTTIGQWCRDEGAQVMLHEYAPWYGFHMDGSGPLESFIDQSSVEQGGGEQGMAHINPAGNLSTSQKLYKNVHPAGQTTTITVSPPPDTPNLPFGFIGLTILWHDVDRDLAIVLEDPDGYSVNMPVTEGILYDPFHDGLFVYAERDDSDRGTARVDVYIFEPDLAVPIAAGDYLAHITDPAPTTADDFEVIAYVADDVSGWGLGLHFPEHSSEDHLIGYPGTADFGIAVAAHTGNGYLNGTPGQRAGYSGRGYRIDGEAILSISAPDDPIVPGYRTGSEASYVIYGGTSGASPHVAGAAALLKQHQPDLDGLGVRQALRDGAITDDATGAVPNDDFGYGKLRIHRSLFGSPAPDGAAPTIDDATVTAYLGEPSEVTPVASDADDADSALELAIDRDYDGVDDELVPLAPFPVATDTLGTQWIKLRVTDPSGRSDSALIRVDVVERAIEPEPEPPPSGRTPSDGLLTGRAGGCLCSLPATPSPAHGGWLLMLGIAGFATRRRQRGRR